MLKFKQNYFDYLFVLTLIMSFISPASQSEETFVDVFNETSLWRYIGDSVMGGISTGSIFFETNEQGERTACLNGSVSTANNGGFIQMRKEINRSDREELKDVSAVVIEARGNDEEYFVHIRTKGMLMPWTYYYVSFIATSEFREFVFPLDQFKRSGRFLGRNFPRGRELKSIGLVAFGKDYEAQLCSKKVSFLKPTDS